MPRVLITIPDGTPQPYRFDLSRRLVSLGRGADNDIVIDSGSVSLKHAEMVRNDDGYELRDLGSTNGLKLDGERRMSVPLEPGTTVLIGDVAFDFQLSEEEISELTGIPVVITTGGGSGIWWLIGLILIVLAFLVGFSIRHQKATGKSLMDEWFKKPAPAQEAAPANP
jgi:pSer/pThr/pTyr-binding forkhead associated (FHA) protein